MERDTPYRVGYANDGSLARRLAGRDRRINPWTRVGADNCLLLEEIN